MTRLCSICLSVLALALAAVPAAEAERSLLPFSLETKNVPGGQIEGACGVAVSGSTIYVSDYYHHAVDVFRRSDGQYQFRLVTNPLDGPCGLATSTSGSLYANEWHQSVSRLLPSVVNFDSANSTGVAVDQATGAVYVDDRTYVAVYEPSGGAPVLKIGAGTLLDAYGVAVSGAKVYVPDAGDDTVKVYEPATDPVNPAAVIDGAALPGGGFNSLVDAAVAVDPTNGHILVVDNLQPGFEHPEAAIYEFGSAGEFLGALSQRIIDGEPSGLAFAGSILYVTSGNDEYAEVLSFGPYVAGGPGFAAPALAPAPVAAAAESRQESAPTPVVASPAGPALRRPRPACRRSGARPCRRRHRIGKNRISPARGPVHRRGDK